ncbi:sphingosine N-acyltransferase lag1 [Lunasporangiospora selenospora]|uniref:Sphingosine N-acyltransferase lag1 n=1 Tax=Lunasporangiospora selenospora TaxID=979761 RepID=A0A9P6G213_9FUNG|nr:sphingosine N-acyltransferase lag1 [Lunasporangiospora selenospora]
MASTAPAAKRLTGIHVPASSSVSVPEKPGSKGSSSRRNPHPDAMNTQHRRGLLGAMARHQIDGPLVLIVAVLGMYALFPTSFARKFILFQAYDAATDTYGQSMDDLYFLFFWVAVFTFLRAALMTYVLMPMARLLGATSERLVVRFAEQGWSCLYYSCSWVLGMSCLQQTTTWNNKFIWYNTDEFFDGFPITSLSLVTKSYYLLQFSFWLSQLFVICIEEPRKDFVAMICHHIVTLLLIISSLLQHITTFGIAVFVSMDLADIILSFGKCLKYIEMPDKICDPIFACFMGVWVYTRHFLYGTIIYAWIAHAGNYFSTTMYLIIGGLLLMLQSLMYFWLWSILRIVYKMFVSKGGVVDDRSDDEDETVEESTSSKQKTQRRP